MKTLQLSEQKAKQLYPEATPEFKAMLEETFGPNFFNPDPATWAKSFQDFLDLEQKREADVYSESDDPIDAAEKRIKFVVSVLNKGKTGRPIHYPFFCTAGGFSVHACDCAYTITFVGARLRVFSADHARFLGKLMEADYKIYLGY